MCCWVTLLRFGLFSIFLVENEKIQELNGFQKADFLFSKLTHLQRIRKRSVHRKGQSGSRDP